MTMEKMFPVILSFALACGILGVRVSDAAIVLPKPSLDGKVSVEKAIQQRRTIRDFRETPLSVQQLAQLLWAAQGITEPKGGKRAVPSGGAQYPLDLYVIVGKNGVEGLEEGVYRYRPENHSISSINGKDLRGEIGSASLGQMWMAGSPVMFVITAEYKRITGRYGDRGMRYAQIEVGHVGQNLFLQAEALGLRAGIVGAFNDWSSKRFKLPRGRGKATGT
jgi:SagB-type dehydrogenase family enzyme